MPERENNANNTRLNKTVSSITKIELEAAKKEIDLAENYADFLKVLGIFPWEQEVFLKQGRKIDKGSNH